MLHPDVRICCYTKPRRPHKPTPGCQQNSLLTWVSPEEKKISIICRRKKEPKKSACIESILKNIRSEATMAAPKNRPHFRGLVLLSLFLGRLWETQASLFLYSVPDETEGAYVSEISQRIWGWSPGRWRSAECASVYRGRTQLFVLNSLSGSLVTAEE